MSDKSNHMDMTPDIKPETDEVASYSRNSKRDSPKQSNFNGLLVFALVLMAALMGVGGYTLYELQLQLEVSGKLLQEADEERTRLEEDLTVSGVKSSNAFKKTNDQQQLNISELRKLWAIAYQQNKPKIEQLAKSLQRIEAASKRLGIDNTKFSASLKQNTQKLNEVRQNLMNDNDDMSTQVSMVRGQIQDQVDKVEKNNRVLSSLTGKIKGLEEDMETFDGYRQQTNKTLLDLQNQLNTR